MRLIDADKLQERAYQMRFDTRITEGGLALINYLLSEEQTVDPVKHGRWITEVRTNKDGTRMFVYACSLCGNMAIDVFKYCPNCGGRNEVDENDCY